MDLYLVHLIKQEKTNSYTPEYICKQFMYSLDNTAAVVMTTQRFHISYWKYTRGSMSITYINQNRQSNNGQKVICLAVELNKDVLQQPIKQFLLKTQKTNRSITGIVNCAGQLNMTNAGMCLLPDKATVIPQVEVLVKLPR